MHGVEIKRLERYDRTIVAPPDKSISVRAVIFNSYASGSSTIKNLSLCDDVKSAVACMPALGARIELDGNTAHITGTGGAFADCELDCGNSATLARLLIGLLSGVRGRFVVRGDASLSKRPFKRLTDILRSAGARIQDSGDGLPITIIGGALTGLDTVTPVASAQIKSALLLAGLNAGGTTRVTERESTRDHTEIMLEAMGADVCKCGTTTEISASGLTAADITMPGDISSAAYPLCLALSVPNGKCTVKNTGVNKTRTGLLEILRGSGASVEARNYTDCAEPFCDVTVRNDGNLSALEIPSENLSGIIDEIPAMAALACRLRGDTFLPLPEELKHKETDRTANIVRMLKSCGADFSVQSAGVLIKGGGAPVYCTVDPDGDHRIAMAAAVATASGAGGFIVGGDCASVSYPDFYGEVIGEKNCFAR